MVTVDEGECIGCSLCEDMAPDIFEINDMGIAVVLKEPETDDEKDQLQDAIDGCPVMAITE